jgi:uncharacterized protein
MMETYLETASGLHYHFLDPQPDEIDITDIAFALSNKARFSGHTQFYSVAEHSIAVAKRLPRRLQLAGLLHDAAEAYLGDVPSPLKACLPDYRKIEAINEAAIFKKFDIELVCPFDIFLVKQADLQALYNETSQLLPSGGVGWSMFEGFGMVYDDIYPQCLYPEDVFQRFMGMYCSLTDNKQMEFFT